MRERDSQNRYTIAVTGQLEFVFDIVLVGLLDDDFTVPDSDKYFVTDIHPRDCEFVLVEIEVDVVIVAIFVFRTAWTQLLFPYHRGIL